MSAAFISHLQSQIEATKEDGLYKKERVITSQQQADIGVAGGEHVINFCANNYLGLANNESLIEAAKEGLDSHGFGVASVRFICGTQDIHKQLEASISDFLGTEDTILYPSCFDANGGLFETLLGPEDAIIKLSLLTVYSQWTVSLPTSPQYVTLPTNTMQWLWLTTAMQQASWVKTVKAATNTVV